ncbi:hypothetical protein EDC96DRAFT_609733 [Choanephora cucurbitarum]|nr:hypothetical protein EDC96DRAFT_609733 [Choanephora cucurbitarum]
MSFDSERLDEVDEEDQAPEDQTMDDTSSLSSSPSIPDEDIDFDLVYALHTFAATVEGQASVMKGDALVLMEDTNIYWWLVEVIKSREIGYIPAENIETPYERLARLNKHRNIEITSPSANELNDTYYSTSSRQVTIADESLYTVLYYEVESEIDPDELEHFIEEYEDIIEDGQVFEEEEEEEEEHDEEWCETPISEKAMIEEEGQITVEAYSAQEEQQHQSMSLRVFAGNIGQGPLFHTVSIRPATTAEELLQSAINKFGLQSSQLINEATIEYYLAVQGTDGDDYILSVQDKPYSIFKTLTDSLTTPMPSLSHIHRLSQPAQRRPRSSSFSNYEQTSFDEDSVIRFYLHRRIKRADEREGLVYIKVSLYPDHQKKKTEIDRIDKIIPVRQDSRIGDVIHLALEKFHIPDARASGFAVDSKKNGKRQLIHYKMFVRGNHQEVELEPNEFMSTVLFQQQQASSYVGPITSDLLFVLRKGRKSTEIKLDDYSTERRPSILDILMENTPFNERRPNAASPIIAESPTRLTEQDRRQLNSLNNTQQPSPFTSSSFSSNKQFSDQMETDLKQDSRKKESLRQQFKRFVGWGSSSSSVTKKQQQQQLHTLTQPMPAFTPVATPSPTITPASTPTSMSVMIPYNNPDVVLPPSVNSTSDLDSISAPSTPLPPTPSTLPKPHPTNHSNTYSQNTLQSQSTDNTTPTTLEEVEDDEEEEEVDVFQDDSQPSNRVTRQGSIASFDTATSSVSPEEIAAATSHAFQSTEDDSDAEEMYYPHHEEQQEQQHTEPVAPTTPSVSLRPSASSHHLQISNTNVQHVNNSSKPSEALADVDSQVKSPASQSLPLSDEPSSLHPMPHTDLDDLFLLVAHGIDFLTSKENTQWEEEGGYEFHPWNRPESSFAKVRKQEKKQQESTQYETSSIVNHLSSPSSPPPPTPIAKQTAVKVEQEDSSATLIASSSSYSTSSSASSSNSSSSSASSSHTSSHTGGQTELRMVPSKQSIATNESLSKSTIKHGLSNKKQAVDDEELQRIVAAHIVF